MPEPIALQEGEPSLLVPAENLSIRIARYVSTILSPIVVSLPAILLISLYHESNRLIAAAYTVLTFLFLGVGLMLYILIGVRMGKFTDRDVSERSQRTGPYLFCILSCIAVFLLLSLVHGPKNLQTVLLITIVGGIIMMVTTFWWKISIHASSLATSLTVLTALYGAVILPAYSLLVLVGWSRVVLRRHTLAQVVAGSLLGIVSCTVILLMRGI